MKKKRVNLIMIFLIFIFPSCIQNKKNIDKTINQKATSSKKKISLSSEVSIKKGKKENSNSKIPTIKLGTMILVSSGNFSESKEIKIKNINFYLVEKGKDTIYLTTSDLNFTTPEGFRIGTTFSDLPVDIQKNLIKETGWGYYYNLSSGWSLGFAEGVSCTDSYPDTNSKVKWIFKRKQSISDFS